ncbi:MAG: penicillin acylase family protein [Bacteroidia bacterium]
MKRFAILLFLCIYFFQSQAQINPDNIKIVRDSFGVPHIMAPTDAEVAYGLAWAHAEDDFKSIQRMLMLAKGRLGEVEGKDGAVSDYFVQFIKAKELVDQRYDIDISADFKKVLEGYAAGLSAYAAKHKKEVVLKDFFPVTGKDIVMGYTVILTSMVGLTKAMQFTMQGRPDDYIFNANLGSNAFAINSKLSDNGHTFLAINPHIPLEGPMSWYEAHLQSEEGWNMYGALFPGMVSPAMGCNDNLGWGVTFNWPDYVDIYRMKLNPKNKNQYWYDGKWHNFEVRKVPLKVKTKMGKITVKREALWCKYGPAMRVKDEVYAFRHNAMFNVKGAEQWYRMGKAQNFSQYKAALEVQGIPLFNFVYGDKNDTIHYIFSGLLPKRTPGYNWQKTLPGDTSATLWNEMYKVDELPQVLNLDCGYVYNTNNTPFRSSCEENCPKENYFDTLSGFYWNRTNNRDLRFRELIESRSQFNYQQIKEIKYDVQYPTKKGGIYNSFLPVYNLDESKYPEIADAIAHLKKWDFSGKKENRHTALALITFNYLFKAIGAGYKEMELGISYSEELLVQSIKQAKEYLIKHHGTFDLPLGDVQKLIRGDKKLPLQGMPETLGSLYAVRTDDGYLKGVNGDTFVMFADFSKEGNSFEAVVPFGASRHPDSPHYTDQMELYSNQQLKKVSLDKNLVIKNAIRIYSPK